MSKRLRKTWALANNIFDKDTAEFILHAYIITRFGKESLRDLTNDEFDALITWIEEMGDV